MTVRQCKRFKNPSCASTQARAGGDGASRRGNLNLFLRQGKTAGISIKTPSRCCIKPSLGLDIYSAAERLSVDTQVVD